MARGRPVGALALLATLVVGLVGCGEGTGGSPGGGLAPFAGRGPADQVALLRDGGVEALLERSEDAMALPRDVAAREALARDQLARIEAGDAASVPAWAALAEVWAPVEAARRQRSYAEVLAAVLRRDGFSGYQDHDLDISRWVSVEVDGDRARATFIGVRRVDRNANAMVPEPVGWIGDHEVRWDVDLVRHAGPWKLAAVATQRTDGMSGY